MSDSLRPYQIEAARKGAELLNNGKTPYFAMEVRTGKTLTAFATMYLVKAKRVLFVTRKLAMQSISSDFNLLGQKYFELMIINYDSLHKIKGEYDGVIIDEAHSLGAFPKPSKRTVELKRIIERSKAKVVLMSGTPNPEGFSQLFHQFWVCGLRSPFAQFKNFYAWAKIYVSEKQKYFHGLKINDYGNVKEELLKPVIDELFIKVSQQEAGFNQVIQEEIKYIPVHEGIQKVVEKFVKSEMYMFKDNKVILGDMGVKKLTKVHQLYSGTVKTEDGTYKKLVDDKAQYILANYKGKKIAIYYVYISEGDILRELFPNNTNNPKEFNESPDKVFISQIQSGSMGVNLSSADYIIFYNIHYSSLLYWQARARMQSKERIKESIVHWIFVKGGIEEKIYKVVLQKKDYTTKYFDRDYGTKTTNQNNKAATKQGGLCC